METRFLYLFQFLAIVYTYPSNLLKYNHQDNNTPENNTLISIPQVNGTFRWMTLDEIEKERNSLVEMRKPLEITYELFTRSNSGGEYLFPNDYSSLSLSSFNATHPTRVIIHGWQSSSKNRVSSLIRDAYLSRGDFNVISVDWSDLASSTNYIKVQSKIPQVGKQIAEFIDFLNSHNAIDFKNLYLIGHSLGAHAAGFAGKTISFGRINTIIGLDPALALYNENNPETRLSINDAEYVETIHTNTGLLGATYPIGNASFFPNGGRTQPGCSFFNIVCSHARAYEFFAESIQNHNNFIAKKCDSYQALLSNSLCTNYDEYDYYYYNYYNYYYYDNDFRTYNFITMGGEPSNYQNQVNGIFYLKTNSEPPFALGEIW